MGSSDNHDRQPCCLDPDFHSTLAGADLSVELCDERTVETDHGQSGCPEAPDDAQSGMPTGDGERQAEQQTGNRDLTDGADIEQSVIWLSIGSETKSSTHHIADTDFEQHESIGEAVSVGLDLGSERPVAAQHTHDRQEISGKTARVLVGVHVAG